jgi:hypothetical protein
VNYGKAKSQPRRIDTQETAGKVIENIPDINLHIGAIHSPCAPWDKGFFFAG